MRFSRVGIAAALVAGAIAVAARGAGAEPPKEPPKAPPKEQPKEPPKAPPKETASEWAKKAIEALEKGTIGQVADLGKPQLHGINLKELAKDPDVALAFTKAVQDEAPRRATQNMETARVYVILAQQTAAAMQQMNANDFRTKRAGAYATMAQCRFLAVRGAAPTFEDWLKAGDLAVESYDTEAGQKDGAFAAGALAWMRSAAAMPGADAAAFQKRSDALFAVLSKFPDGPVIALGKATAKMTAVDALLRQPTPPAPAALKPLLEDLVAILAPHAQPTGSPAACALWQEVVTIARSRKVPGIKADYLMGPPAAQLNMTWQLPLGGRWKESGPSGNEPAHLADLDQQSPDGRALHHIGVRMYRWELHYRLGESLPFKGDSPKEMIVAVQTAYKKAFSSITSQKDVVKRELGEGMPAQTFEMEGISAETGEPLSLRVFVVRGRETRGTFLVDARTYGKAPPGDPELDAVLKTFREVKGGK